MDNKKGLPKRKDLRLKQYDYSSKGAYFVTMCTKDRAKILSDITKPVGVGALDDPKTNDLDNLSFTDKETVCVAVVGVHDDTQIRLTSIGQIVERNLLSSENISGVKIDRYVIMPNLYM